MERKPDILAKIKTDSELALLDHISEIKEETDKKIEETSNNISSELEQVRNSIIDIEDILNNPQEIEHPEIDYDFIIDEASKRVPEGKDYILTDEDKYQISKSIKIPILEKEIIIEKTEVIRETPIVTENVVEKAVTDEPNIIVDKINSSDNKIKKEKIEGLEDLDRIPEIERKIIANAQGNGVATTSFFNGIRAKNLNIVGAIATQQGDTVNVEVPSSGGGTPSTPNGSLQYNNNGVFGGSANATLDENGNITLGTPISGIYPIKLNGSDGSASFVGGGVKFDDIDGIVSKFTLSIKNGDTLATQLNYDGSASFAGGLAQIYASGQFSFQNGDYYSSTDGTGNFLTLKNDNYYQLNFQTLSQDIWHFGPYYPDTGHPFGFYAVNLGYAPLQVFDDGRGIQGHDGNWELSDDGSASFAGDIKNTDDTGATGIVLWDTTLSQYVRYTSVGGVLVGTAI